MADTWRKQWRKIWDNPMFHGRGSHMLVWTWLLDHAVWKDTKVMFRGEVITMKPGQLLCGSIQIENATGVPASTVRRIMAQLVDEQMIDHQMSNKPSLVTVKKWAQYQGSEQQNDQQESDVGNEDDGERPGVRVENGKGPKNEQQNDQHISATDSEESTHDDQQNDQQMSSRQAPDEQQMITKEEGKKSKKPKKNSHSDDSSAPQTVPESEVEFRRFIEWLNTKNFLGSPKQWTEQAQKKWNRRRKEFDARTIGQAFANLQNDPRKWWIENHGWRPLAWWLDKEARIQNMLNCHKSATSKPISHHVKL